MGVRDVGEVSGRCRNTRYRTCGPDDRGADRKHQPGLVDGRTENQCTRPGQSFEDGIGVDDGAGVELWTHGLHEQGTGGADSM